VLAQLVPGVVRSYFPIRRQGGAQGIREFEVDGRHVVESADPHRQQHLGNHFAVLGHPAHREPSLARNTKLGDAISPRMDEGVHDRRDEDFSASMGLEVLLLLEHMRVGHELRAVAKRVPPRALHLLAHLPRQSEQGAVPEGLRGQILAVDQRRRRLDGPLLKQELLEKLVLREHREQGDDVGEAFVERRLVGAGGVEIAGTKRIDEGVGGLVHHDIVREARVDRGATLTGEITEDQSFFLRSIEGVRVQHPVRRDFELMSPERPSDTPPQRELEPGQRLHDERVHVLRVEAIVLHDPRIASLPGGWFFGAVSGQVVGAVKCAG